MFVLSLALVTLCYYYKQNKKASGKFLVPPLWASLSKDTFLTRCRVVQNIVKPGHFVHPFLVMPPPRATASKSRPGSPSRDALSLPALTSGGELGVIPEGMSVDPAAGSTSSVNPDVSLIRVKEEATPKDGKIFATPIQNFEPIKLQQVVYCNMPPALRQRHGLKEGARGIVQYFNTTTLKTQETDRKGLVAYVLSFVPEKS